MTKHHSRIAVVNYQSKVTIFVKLRNHWASRFEACLGKTFLWVTSVEDRNLSKIMKFITWLRYLIFLISLSQSDAINKIFCDLLTSVPFPALAAVQLSILWVLIGCLTYISLVWLAVAVTLVFTPEWSFFIWEDALQNHFPCEVLILSSCDETNLDVGLHLSFFNKTEKNPGFHAFSTYACHFPTTDFSFWKLELESDGGKLVSSHVSGQVYVLVRGKKITCFYNKCIVWYKLL